MRDWHRTLALVLSFAFSSQVTAAEEVGKCTGPQDHGGLRLAAAACDLQEVRSCLKRGVQATAADAHGVTALHKVMDRCSDTRRQLSIADELIKAGAKVNALTLDGRTPLGIALRTSREAVSIFLLNSGAGREEGADTRGYVYAAAFNGFNQALELLLDAGRDPNTIGQGTDNERPLAKVIHQRNARGFALLLDAKADPNALSGSLKNTALHELFRNPIGQLPPIALDAEMAKRLTNSGAKLDIRNKDGLRPVESALRAAFNPHRYFHIQAALNAIYEAGGQDELLTRLYQTTKSSVRDALACKPPLEVHNACTNAGSVVAALGAAVGDLPLPGEWILLDSGESQANTSWCKDIGKGWRPLTGQTLVQVAAVRNGSTAKALSCSPPTAGSEELPSVVPPQWTCPGGKVEAALITPVNRVKIDEKTVAIGAFLLDGGGNVDVELLPAGLKHSAMEQLAASRRDAWSYRYSVASPFLNKARSISSTIDQLANTNFAETEARVKEYKATIGSLLSREQAVEQAICEAITLLTARRLFVEKLEELVSTATRVGVSNIWTIKLDCEWDESGNKTAVLVPPEGYDYCKHSERELSNSRDGNSRWFYKGRRKPNGVAYQLECSGSHFPFDRWGSWVELEVTVVGVLKTAPVAERDTLGCRRPESGSGIMCVCSASPGKAVKDAYRSGGAGIAHLEVVFSSCTPTEAECGNWHKLDCDQFANLGYSLHVVTDVPMCR